MIPSVLLLPLALLTPRVYSQDSSLSSAILTSDNTIAPTSDASALTSSGLPGTPLTSTTSGTSNATATSSSSSTTSKKLTVIVGQGPSTASSNATASATSTPSSPRPTANTQPCNGYVEFCDRKFSNVSMVVAHNSPFVKPHNAASNQEYPVLTQLHDGIRGLQFETHKPNETSQIHLCHTSCDLLDVGLLSTYLATVKSWLDANPFEVIAIMMGNNNGDDFRILPSDYASAYDESGITPYLWIPPTPTMNLSDWPTLSEMILKNKRVVVMLDYNANQTQVPWLLDQFNYQWQTPFSPTDPSFPCTEQRPPNQPEAVSRNRMYMLNHNLNIAVNLPGFSQILIPAYSLLDQVNAVSGNASVGGNVKNCTKMWDRPPNWILVDYYNFGNFNGSVFEVAAEANGVRYHQGSCCGPEALSGASSLRKKSLGRLLVSVVVVVAWCLVW